MTLWQRVRSRTSVWTLLFGFTAGMQIFRQAYPDALIFGLFTVLLALESSGALRRWKFGGVQVKDSTAIAVALFSALFIYFSHRQAATLLIYLIALGAMLFVATWRRANDHERLSKRQFGSAVYWAVLATALGLWEFLAMFLSTLAHEDKFPTLSVIFLPKLESPLVKFQFIALWLGLGLYFFERWKNR